MAIDFQNENLIACLQSDGNVTSNEVVATVPDVIAVIETDSGRPVCTEEYRYGLRVSVLGLPANDILRTPEALRWVGPGYFGYTGVEYRPLGSFVTPKSVIEMFVH